jgi:hypothetical protein
MKKLTIATVIILNITCMFFSCKGGFSGQKMDSTMLDTDARDSAAALNHAVKHQDSLKAHVGKSPNK